MKNRNVEFFNLSFLDLLSGALAAIIFLFIIVPKGEITIHDDPVMVTYDTIQKHFYGKISDPFASRKPGDTILAIVGGLEGIRLAESKTEEPEKPEPVANRTRPQRDRPEREVQQPEKKVASVPSVAPSKLDGSRPDVPCVLSIEIKWAKKEDNIDLFVCKENACVFGGRRHRDFIGYWDSGKARTSLFGGDLRTNQEAVRQFDEIIPGTYDIHVQYKESENPKPKVPIRLQVYTRNEDSKERGTQHYYNLDMNPTQKTHIARVIVSPGGEIEFQSFK